MKKYQNQPLEVRMALIEILSKNPDAKLKIQKQLGGVVISQQIAKGTYRTTMIPYRAESKPSSSSSCCLIL